MLNSEEERVGFRKALDRVDDAMYNKNVTKKCCKTTLNDIRRILGKLRKESHRLK